LFFERPERTLIADNEKIFAMEGYSLNVQPKQIPY